MKSNYSDQGKFDVCSEACTVDGRKMDALYVPKTNTNDTVILTEFAVEKKSS